MTITDWIIIAGTVWVVGIWVVGIFMGAMVSDIWEPEVFHDVDGSVIVVGVVFWPVTVLLLAPIIFIHFVKFMRYMTVSSGHGARGLLASVGKVYKKAVTK